MSYGVQPGGGWGPVMHAHGSTGCGGRPTCFAFGGPRCWVAAMSGARGRVLTRLALAAAAAAAAAKLYSAYRRRQRRQRWREAGRDVVVLHTWPRLSTCPNMSPFALKVETYCRMAGIVYVIDTEEPIGSKGLSPWITINGEEITDSELIMEYLQKHFNQPVAATAKLSAEQRGIGRCVQLMLDEHAMGCMAMKRYVIDKMAYVEQIVPEKMQHMVTIYRLFFLGKIKNSMYIRGVGRFSEQEVLFFLYRDLQALADIVGKKSFLLANEPTDYDAAVFAGLTQVLCACAPEVEVHVRQQHDNLVQYFDRMKAKFWADWDNVLEK